MKNKQRTSTKVIISYNDGSTYTFTNVQQFSLVNNNSEIEVTQIRNKDKFIRTELSTYTKLTHVKSVTYLPVKGDDLTYNVVNGKVVEKIVKSEVQTISNLFTVTLKGCESGIILCPSTTFTK